MSEPIWKYMPEKEALEYLANRYRGKTITTFARKESGAYEVFLERGIVRIASQEGIFLRKRSPLIYKRLSDSELIEDVVDNHKGETLHEFNKKARGACNELRKRKLLDGIIKKGIIIRTSKPWAFYSRMSDEEALGYLSEHHAGESIIEFKNKNQAAYDVFRSNGTVSVAVQKCILVRQIKSRKFFRKWSDTKLIEYLVENHEGECIGELSNSDKCLLDELKRRNIFEKVIEEGTIIRKRDYSLQHRTQRNLDFIAKNETATKLAASYIVLNEKEPELTKVIEQIMSDLYSTNFKDIKEIRSLLLGNQKTLEKSITNLGPYLGEFTLEEKQIFPVFLGDVFNSIKDMPGGIEERIFRAYRGRFSPAFNENPENVIKEIKNKISDKKTNMNKIYKKLYSYYQKILELSKELN